MIRHYLDFVTSGHGLREIDEPFGFDGAEFTIMQDNGRLGRDVFGLVGGAKNLRLVNMANHCFEEVLYNNNTYGFEAVVKYIIEFDDEQNVIGQIDFAALKTDQTTYIEFLVEEENERALLKRRADLNVNIFSPLDLDGNEIEPCLTTNVFLKPKPIIQLSQWQPQAVNAQFVAFGLDGAFINPYPNLIEFGVQTSYAPFFSYKEINFTEPLLEQTRDESSILKSSTNFRDVKVRLTDINLIVSTIGEDVRTAITIGWGNSYEAGEFFYEDLFVSSGFVDIEHQDYEFTIPFLNETDFVFLQISVSQPRIPAGTPVSTSDIVFSSNGGLFLEGTSIAKPSIVPCVRLIDAIKYVVKSISGLEVSAPRWEFGGEFYDQYITTTPLLRNLTDKPFNLTFKDIVSDYFPEPFADYQIRRDGTVFIGNYSDFYRDYMVGNYQVSMYGDNSGFSGQIEGFERGYNELYTLNKISIGYENYGSQKENEQANTYDEVHGESEWYIQNKLVQNAKEVSIGWIRSAFLLELSRQKGFDLTDTAATQDDSKVYLIDVVDLRDWDREQTQTAFLQHKAPGTFVLELTNDQTFPWTVLGMAPGDTFTITSSVNAAPYTITSITETRLRLVSQNFYEPVDNVGVNTTFEYTVSSAVTSLVNRTKEGFSLIEGLADGDNYANLRFTNKTIVVYYGRYFATCNMFTGGKPVVNTIYNNNPLATTQTIGGIEIQEGRSFVPVNPILTPYLDKVFIVISLQECLRLDNMQRLENGYIKYFDAQGLPKKGYIKKGVWRFLSKGGDDPGDYIGIMETDIEEKYQQFYIEIVSLGDGSIVIDSDITTNSFDYEIDNFQNLHIFDAVGKLISPPVPYNRVRVNNSGQATSALELAQWLESIQ